MINIPTIETERLILRALQEQDFLAELDFWKSERANFVGGKKSRNEVWRMIAMLCGHWQFRGYGFFAVLDKQSGEYYGRVGPWYPEGWPEPEIGWTIMEPAEGKGIAYEAALACRNYVYEQLNWKTAISLIDPANSRSLALATRLGAKLDGTYNHSEFGVLHIHRHPSPEALT